MNMDKSYQEKNAEQEKLPYQPPRIIEQDVIKAELQTNALPDEPPPPL